MTVLALLYRISSWRLQALLADSPIGTPNSLEQAGVEREARNVCQTYTNIHTHTHAQPKTFTVKLERTRHVHISV